MSYAVQLYTVREALQADLSDTIRRLSEMGYTRVEPYDFVGRADEMVQALASHDVTAPTGHAPLLSHDQDEIFQAAQRLGISTVIDPYLPAEHWKDPATIRTTAAQLNAAAKKGAEYGIRVGYHNHYWELVSKVDGQTALEYFAGLLDPEVVLEIDTYWAAVGGEDPLKLLERLGDRVVAIHIKDGPATTDTRAQLPAGQGNLPIPEIIAAAKFLEVGVVEFDDYEGDVFDGVAQSLAYLKAHAPR